MTFSIIAIVVQIVMTIASAIYQITQSKKKATPQASQDSSDAKKGFELVVEGRAEFLPKIYGRAKIGGVRVFHETSSNYVHATINADQSFQSGFDSTSGGTFSRQQYDVLGNLYNEVTTYQGQPSGVLTSSITGVGKNEFLYTQQALCQGPINDVIEIIIDETRFLDDPALGNYVVRNETTYLTNNIKEVKISWEATKTALRVNIFKSGGVADATITANFNERKDATFNNIAYASAVVRLDRDDPQFSGVPTLQFLIEGALVRTVAGGILSTTYTYSNNPSWCLLDYLLDNICGKGVSLDEVDLVSFENSAAVCATIVQTNAVVGGKIYQPTNDSRNIFTRNIPLYECNIITDPKKSIRDNIEAILETMGDARLVWSGGKYRLNLQYPVINANLVVATTITDDDLVLDQDVAIAWPTASQRLNYCAVRFHNECEDFKEDSASWPPKYSSSVSRGIGGFKYSHSISGHDDGTAVGSLLNELGVWSGVGATALDYKVLISKADFGSVTLSFAADASGTITITDDATSTVIYTGSAGPSAITSASLSLGSVSVDKVYSIHFTGAPSANDRAIAAKLEKSNKILWTTRSTAYTAYSLNTYSSAIYDSMMVEDSGLELPMDMFSEGITDYYHALAKAEELVRTSRSAFTMQFKYTIRNNYLEPGDYIKLQSEAIYAGSVANPLYLKVESVKITEDSSCELTVTRFDYTQLAWSMKDNIYIEPKKIYDSLVVGPAWVEYTPLSGLLTDSSGTLNWASVSLVDQYIIYMHSSDDVIGIDGFPVFSEIGRVNKEVTTFSLPLLKSTSAFFGVKASSNGLLSSMTYTDITKTILLTNISYSFSGLTFTYNSPVTNSISWTAFSVVLNSTTVKSVIAGNLAWTSGTLYIYYDPIANVVLGTSSINLSSSGKLLATYTGGINITQQASNLVPPVNLYVSGTTSNIYSSRDLELTWDYPVENDSKNIALASYVIQIIDTTSSVVKYREEITPTLSRGGYFKFTYTANVTYFGTATRSFTVKVFSVDLSGALSSAATLVVNNPVPVAPVYTATGGFSQTFLKVTTSTTDLDIAGYLVYRSTTTPIVKDLTTLVYEGKDTNIVLSATSGIQHYYTIAAYDSFGNTGLTYSAEIAATATSTDPDTYTYTGLVFKPGYSNPTTVTPDAIYWTSFVATKNGTTSVTVVAGTTTWTTGTLYLYYIPGNNTLQFSTSLLTAITGSGGVGGRVIATYKGGTDLTADSGKAFISGDQLLAGTVAGSSLIGGTLVVTGASSFGDNLVSSNYTTTGTPANPINAGWKLSQAGDAFFNSVTIKNPSGNTVFSSGTGAEWSYVNGKPTTLSALNTADGTKLSGIATGATVGANLGTWGLASNTYVLTGNAVTTSNSISKSIATEAWDTHANATTGLVENGLLTFNKTPIATDTSPTLTGTATISSNSYVNNTTSTVSVTSSKNFTNNSALTFTKAVSTRSVPLLCQGNVTVSAVNGAGAVTLTKLLAVQSSWDSDVVTTQVNTGAAVVVSFTVAAQGFMIGLNKDPKLNYSYTSLDYAFYINGTTWAIYESNANPVAATAFAPTDVFTISYSGTTITYAINGVTKRIVTVAAGLTFYFDSSWYTLGASAANVTYTANGVLDHSFTANPYFDLATRSITHPYATAAWGYAAAYSTQSFVGGCYLIFNASVSGIAMLGFNSDPLVTTSFQGLDYAWHISGGNSLIYESGTNTLAAEAYTVDTVFEMLYLGNTIYYYKDGVLKRTVVTTAGRTFWLDAAFSNVSTFRNIYFDSVKDKISSSVCLSAGSSMDYGFYFNAGMTTNTVAVMEAGVGVTTPATHLSTDIFTVEYIGTSVIYKVNGVIVRTSTVAAGKVLHLYAESYILAEAVSNIGVFGLAKTPASAIGLSTSTTLASAYTNMPVGVMFNNGLADTYDFIVNGAIIPFGGSYLSSDTFSITYAGTVITVLKNGIVVGTTTVSSALTFYLDTYLYRTSEIFSDITYSYMGTLGANLSGKMSSDSISTYIEDAAIGSAQIGSINLVGNFNVKSATAGARMEMDSGSIKVYDASGILRVQLGNLI